jgi:hypothetical protein
MVFLLGSVFAGVFWLIGSGWPLLLIGLGAWLFWHEDGAHRRRSRRASSWVTGPARGHHRPEPKPQPRRQDETTPPRQSELPIDIQVKVEQIRRKVDVLLGYADRFPPFSHDLYLVRQTATEYLPGTINAFLALPKDSVDKPLVGTAKTGRQELKAQLDLLDSKLDEIAQDLQRQDADRLLANRRFLEARFGNRARSQEVA